jgi:hypothetical protein
MAGCLVPWTCSLSSRETGQQWRDHLVEKWCFSRATVSPTIRLDMICTAKERTRPETPLTRRKVQRCICRNGFGKTTSRPCTR